MALLFHELLEKLKQWDEISLMEFMGLTSEDIVNMFQDKIEDRQEEFREYFEEEDEDES